MKSKMSSDVSVDDIKQNINEGNICIANQRLYTPPQIIRLADSTIESGSITNLAEATGGSHTVS